MCDVTHGQSFIEVKFCRIIDLKYFSLIDPIIISQTDIYRPSVDTMPFEKRDLRHLVVASDNAHVALCYDDGLLWMGNLEEEKVQA